MFKKTHYIALGIVLLLTVIVLKLPGRTATQIKLAIGSVFLPLFGLSGSGQQLADKTGNALTPRADLLRQSDELRRERDELKLRSLQSADVERENERLRQMIGFQRANPAWKLKPARVIAREPANWWRNIQIDLGKRDGLRADLTVLTADGLVGRVAEVGETRSKVILLGDPNCRVAALVQETRENGVVSAGASVLDNSIVELGYLSRSSGLKPGQLVVTSGLGGIFPKGIPIGHLVDFRVVEFGLYTEARVKLSVNLNLLEEVWVMLP